MELLRTENLKKCITPNWVLRSALPLTESDLRCRKGVCSDYGTVGGGKTTLLNMIASLDKPTSGDIYLAGKSFKDIKDKELSAFRRDNLGFIFQDFNLLDTFSIKDNILLPLVLARTPVAEMEARLAPIVQMLGISHLIDKFPMRRPAENAREWRCPGNYHKPQADSGGRTDRRLDSKASANLLGILNRINEDGRTILMVTHSACSRICLQSHVYTGREADQPDLSRKRRQEEFLRPDYGGAVRHNRRG